MGGGAQLTQASVSADWDSAVDSQIPPASYLLKDLEEAEAEAEAKSILFNLADRNQNGMLSAVEALRFGIALEAMGLAAGRRQEGTWMR